MKFEQKFRAKFKIKKILSEDAVSIQIMDTEDFKCEVKGCCLYYDFLNVYVGDIFSAECMFLKSDKAGYVFKVLDEPVLEIPSTETEMAKYLASQVKGVSKEMALKVVKALGINFIGMVCQDHGVLDKTPLKDKQKENVVDWCENHLNLHELIGDAYLRGIAPNEVFEIYKKYGMRVIRMIETDPYSLFLYGLVDFKKIDKIALKEGIAEKSISRSAALIYNLINEQEESGSMAVVKENIQEYMLSLNFGEDLIWSGIDYLIKNNFIDKAIFDDITYYGKRDNLYAERIIADYVKEIKNKDGYSQKVIEMNFKGSELNKQQKDATFGCLSKKLSLLVGGPGTGKTFTIKRIIKTVKAINPDIQIALMAPTGKAASRMVEMIGMDATTIHAALGISEGDDIIHKDGLKLDKDLIIIDEASMIDEVLFSYFCRHIKKDAQIILVGDTGQLPSVGAGNLLDSLSKDVTKFELTTICRQDKTSAIVLNAHHIRNKEFNQIEFNDKDFQFIETDEVVETVNKLYHKYLKETTTDNIMILSPQHNKNGTDQINSVIQDENKGKVVKVYHRNLFKQGDRVIQLKNVKKLEIHNGDLGEVESATDKGLNILFDDKEDEIEITELNDIELAYAITVHKSQGSEADIVIMVFNKSHMFTLSNKLIYTALTRTKEKFIGIGNKDSFFKGLEKEEKKRISLISEYIGEYHKIEKEEQEKKENPVVDDNWMIDWINN